MGAAKRTKANFKMENYVTKIRRELHSCPGVGFELDETLQIIRRELDKIGISYTEKYGKSSIVATLGEEREGYTLALRADTDALPIEEKTDVSFKSKNIGKMHACGHDAHTAILLDVIRRAYEIKDEIPFRVKFFFQSAEEYAPGGAKLMVEDGAMVGVDAVAGLHVDPDTEVGKLKVGVGPQNASSNGFYLNFHGASAHAVKKERGKDAIKMAVTSYFEIENLVNSKIKAGENMLFHVGQIDGGKTNNIVANECALFCTLRTFDDETAERMKLAIEKTANETAAKFGGSAELVSVKSYPVIINEPSFTKEVRKAMQDIVGEENVGEKMRTMTGEDFSYFAKEAPGCFFRLGVKNESLFEAKPLHSEKFNLDESALKIGSDVFMQLILNKSAEIKNQQKSLKQNAKK